MISEGDYSGSESYSPDFRSGLYVRTVAQDRTSHGLFRLGGRTAAVFQGIISGLSNLRIVELRIVV